MRDMTGLAPEGPAQHIRVAEVRRDSFHRDLMLAVTPLAQFAIGELYQSSQTVAGILGVQVGLLESGPNRFRRQHLFHLRMRTIL